MQGRQRRRGRGGRGGGADARARGCWRQQQRQRQRQRRRRGDVSVCIRGWWGGAGGLERERELMSNQYHGASASCDKPRPPQALCEGVLCQVRRRLGRRAGGQAGRGSERMSCRQPASSGLFLLLCLASHRLTTPLHPSTLNPTRSNSCFKGSGCPSVALQLCHKRHPWYVWCRVGG